MIQRVDEAFNVAHDKFKVLHSENINKSIPTLPKKLVTLINKCNQETKNWADAFKKTSKIYTTNRHSAGIEVFPRSRYGYCANFEDGPYKLQFAELEKVRTEAKDAIMLADDATAFTMLQDALAKIAAIK
jgi:hypothetical protein